MKSLLENIKMSLRGDQIDYTSEELTKTLIVLSIPLVLEMMLQSIFEIVDIFFIGKLGANATAAVGLVSSIIVLIIGVGLGLGIASGALVARYIGQKDVESAKKVAVYAIGLTLLCGIPISMLGLFYTEGLLNLMNAQPEVVKEGYWYCKIAIGATPILLLSMVNNSILRGAGDSSLSLRSIAFSNLVNVILDPLLIFGLFFFPNYGLTGAALATLIGRSVGVIYQFYIFHTGKSRLCIDNFLGIKWDDGIWKELVHKSRTGMFQALIGTASWMAVIRIVSIFGSAPVAGFVIMIRISLFVLLPAIGLANATATLVGQNLGAQKYQRASQSVLLTLKSNVALMLPLIFILFAFAEFWISIFTTDPEVIKEGCIALQITSASLVFWGLGTTMNNALNGSGDIRTPTRINLLCFWMVQIPLGYILSKVMGWGSAGVATAIVVTDCIFVFCGWTALRRAEWFSIDKDEKQTS